jgi:cytochrome c peroxidase
MALALLLVASGIANATAFVGEARSVRLQPAPAPAQDQLRADYRRPATIPFPSDNPYTPAKALLGRTLFHDPRLSVPGALACASCHNAGFSFGDGLARSLGNDMKPLGRRAPTLLNGAWGELYMWDGRAASLEAQALGPIATATEMNRPLDQLSPVLASIPEYKPLFAAAFPRLAVTPERIAQAIATYERTIVSPPAPFDAWIEGDDNAIPASAQRGFALFAGRARCALCHTGWRFTDDGFHDIGLPDADQGRGRLQSRIIKMRHAFKTPGLREIALRAPYMHDGSLATLKAVVAHYNQGGIDRPSRSELIGPLGLSADEQADIVAFLQTLSSAAAPEIVAALPR